MLWIRWLGVTALLHIIGAARGDCPDGWQSWSENCYLLLPHCQACAEAIALCHAQNATLVSVNSGSEARALEQMMTAAGGTDRGREVKYWTGLTVDSNGTYHWTDGSTFDKSVLNITRPTGSCSTWSSRTNAIQFQSCYGCNRPFCKIRKASGQSDSCAGLCRGETGALVTGLVLAAVAGAALLLYVRQRQGRLSGVPSLAGIVNILYRPSVLSTASGGEEEGAVSDDDRSPDHVSRVSAEGAVSDDRSSVNASRVSTEGVMSDDRSFVNDSRVPVVNTSDVQSPVQASGVSAEGAVSDDRSPVHDSRVSAEGTVSDERSPVHGSRLG